MDKKIQIFRVLFTICGSVGVYLFGYLLAISLLSMIPGMRQLHTMYLNAIAMIVAAGLTCFTIKKQEVGIRIEKKPALKMAGVFIMGYSASVLFNFLLGMIPWNTMFEQAVTPSEAVFFGIPLWARMLCYEVVAPLAEEILFRQVIYRRLRSISPVWLAVIVSALLFGLYHGNLVQGIYAFIMGCLLALMYEWTGSLAASVVFHMAANHVSDIAYEFESMSKVVYSPYGAVIAGIVFVIMMTISIKENKCSKKRCNLKKDVV